MDTPLETIGSAATPEQRDALASPLRLEIFGHFLPRDRLSVADLAARMGRSRTSLYYHVHHLVDAGLLRKAGVRGGGRRAESVYEAAASAVRMEPDGSASTREALLRTMAAGFRMAERDLETALEETAPAGAEPVFATRLHFRATPDLLDEVRGHLRAALAALERATGKPPSGPHYSLTLALLPLRGRGRPEDPE